MIWISLAIATYYAVISLIALTPTRRPAVIDMLWFFVGWLTGELSLFSTLIEGLVLVIQWRWGWPADWRGDALVILSVFGLSVNLALYLGMWRARTIVRRVMTSGPADVNFSSVKLRFATWWRTLGVVPLRSSDVRVVRNISYGPHRLQKLDVYRSSLTPKNAPVLMYIHGGAWVFGDKREQARPMMFEFVRQGWVVVSVNYRLAPFDRWPAHIRDVTSALAWVKKNIGVHGGNPEHVVVSGGSAGGHLAALLALTSNSRELREPHLDPNIDLSVDGAIPFYGVHDMTGDPRQWRGTQKSLVTLLESAVMFEKVAANPELFRLASPHHRIAPDAPPFLVIQGRSDTLVNFNVARHFVATYRERVPHSLIWHIELPLAQHAFDLSHSPRTSATTRAAVAFARWCVSRERVGYPDVPDELAAAYQVPPTHLDITATEEVVYVVTPFNPLGWDQVSDPAALNRANYDTFLRELADRQVSFSPTLAYEAATGNWEEPGAALSCDHVEALLLARRFRQYAYYEVRPEVINVRAAKDGRIIR